MGVKGFTLVEILTTVTILGVIAGLAVPVFVSAIEESRTNEARANLNAIYMGLKVYAVNNTGDYWDPGGTNLNDINNTLNLDLAAQYYTEDIRIDANNGAAPREFTARMERAGASTRHFCIYQTGAIDELC